MSMYFNTKNAATKVLVFLSVTCSAGLQAQDTTIVRTLDEVVVTATKYPVKLSQTGKLVDVITHEEIERGLGKSVSQILNEQSGILVNGANSNPGKDKSLYLLGASNAYTLILLDGVPVNDPSGPGGAFDPRMFPVEQIDRIEILKGSQSTLYGSNAIAGVINIITKKGGARKPHINGGLNYGSYNSLNGSAGVNGSTAVIDYNLNYAYSRSNGISEALDTTKRMNFDKDGFMRNALQANFTIKAGNKLRISPYYRYTYYKGDFDADAFTDGNNKYNALFNNTGAVATFALPKGTITANYGYSYAKRNYLTSFGDGLYKGRFNSGEVYITQAVSATVKVLAGINYQTYRLLDTTLDIKNPKTSIVSPYASLFFTSQSGLSLEAGGRYNHHSTFGSNATYSFNASYLINKQVKVFANISSGFKAPTVSDLFGPVYYGSNPDLKPEKSNSTQAGVQMQAIESKLQLSVSGYYRNIKDVIAYVGTQLINIDKQKDKGAELEATFTPNKRLTVKASYNYTTGNLFQLRDGKDTSYYNLIRRPKSTVAASIGFYATKALFVSVSTQSLGRRTDLFFDPNTFASSEVGLNAYTLLNAYAQYTFSGSRFRIFVDGRNLTNTKFMEVYGYATMGANVTGGFYLNF